MHIAICDENIADRKHLERLLSRESDKRMGASNVLYVDCFGDWDHFFINPYIYDMFFIDLISTPTLALDMTKEIRRLGITSPIVLCSSSIDYTTLADLPDNVYHIQKPYVSEPLAALLSMGDEHVKETDVELVELHTTDKKGLNVSPHDIMYSIITKENQHTLYMQDGSQIEILENLGELQMKLESYWEFYRINDHVIVNILKATSIKPFHILMSDHKKFAYSFIAFYEIRYKISIAKITKLL